MRTLFRQGKLRWSASPLVVIGTDAILALVCISNPACDLLTLPSLARRVLNSLTCPFCFCSRHHQQPDCSDRLAASSGHGDGASGWSCPPGFVASWGGLHPMGGQ